MIKYMGDQYLGGYDVSFVVYVVGVFKRSF